MAGFDDKLADGGTLSGLQLGLRGYACHVFDDARMAWSLHREQHLISWRLESDLRVDRFDARNLLDDRTLFRRLKKPAQHGNTSNSSADSYDSAANLEKELHALRYADYEIECPPLVMQETSVENMFPYAYPEDHDDDEENGDGGVYHPPWAVPEHLTQPTSKRLHEIIAATARKARGHPQLEVMLKVKLSANAKFGFLEPSHGFHAYYAYLRDGDPPLRPTSAVTTHGPSLLLGAEYSDSDDEALGVQSLPQLEDTVEAEAAKEELDDDEEVEKKARRLKRAKLLAGHFQYAALEKKAPAILSGAITDHEAPAEHAVDNRKRSIERTRSPKSRSPRRRSSSRSSSRSRSRSRRRS